MNIPMTDLKAQYAAMKQDIDEAIARVINNGQFILGPEVRAFEEEMAAYTGAKYAVGVASGTDALHLALLGSGVGAGDEVITTPFTFIATAEAISRCGATPVFVDIDPLTYNIDTAKIEAKINKKTRAVLPVHLFGQSADMAALMALASRYHLKIVEDCAQALGAEYQGRKVGTFGGAGCLSFFPSKALGAYGDGGMVITDSAEIARKIDILRRHGAGDGYYYSAHGFNSRLDALQAAVLRVKLKWLDDWTARRRKKAAVYARQLGPLPGIVLPHHDEKSPSSFNYYTIRLVGPGINRSALREYLQSKGISTAVYYPLSLHLQEVYRSLGYQPGDFPESELAQEQVLSLPMYPELGDKQIEVIANALAGYLSQ